MNSVYKKRVEEFLMTKRIGIAGYSSHNDAPANAIYRKLKENGYQTYAINPRVEQVKDVACYASIAAAPVKLESMVICTPSDAAEKVVEECAQAGIKYIWLHRSVGEGSYSKAAETRARQLGLQVIPNGCPMMFVKPDVFHRCFKWFMSKKMTA